MPVSREGLEYKHILFKPLPGVDGGGCYADVFLPPAGDGPSPIAVFYHGGGFVVGGAQHINTKHVAYLLEQGVRFDEIRKDLLDGYKWVLDTLPTLEDVDPTRVFLFGSSAGGASTLTVTTDAKEQGLPLPKALYPAYPLVDFTVSAEHTTYEQAVAAATPEQRAMFEQLLGEQCTATHDILAENPGSPSPRAVWANYVITTGVLLDYLGIQNDRSLHLDVDKDWPPTVVLSAGADMLLSPKRHAEALYNKLQEAGVESKLVECEGMAHGAVEPKPDDVAHAWWEECKEALDFCIAKCK